MAVRFRLKAPGDWGCWLLGGEALTEHPFAPGQLFMQGFLQPILPHPGYWWRHSSYRFELSRSRSFGNRNRGWAEEREGGCTLTRARWVPSSRNPLERGTSIQPGGSSPSQHCFCHPARSPSLGLRMGNSGQAQSSLGQKPRVPWGPLAPNCVVTHS